MHRQGAREHDFPDRKSTQYYSHDLEKLLRFAGLEVEMEQESHANPIMKSNWDIVTSWSEESRYENRTLQQAEGLLKAIEDQVGGLLPWLRKHW
jgi:hypothetical protein